MYATKQIKMNLQPKDIKKLEVLLGEHINNEVFQKIVTELEVLTDDAFQCGLHYQETSIRDESVKLVPQK